MSTDDTANVLGRLEASAIELKKEVDNQREEDAKELELFEAAYEMLGQERRKQLQDEALKRGVKLPTSHYDEFPSHTPRREAPRVRLIRRYGPLESAINAHIESLAILKKELKNDFAEAIRKEGRRSMWSGVFINAVFFVLGLAASAIPFSTSGIASFLGLK
jgi:hypothetical protein